MFDLEKLKAVTKIVVHDNCADGTASAILAHEALPWATVEFVQYSTDAHKLMKAEAGILFADFSPHPDRARYFVEAGSIVLDHHKTAKALVESFGENGRFGDEKTQPGVCGASLVYEHICKPMGKQSAFAERFAMLAGVFDTWQRQSPEWEAARVQQAILTFPTQSFWLQLPFSEIAASWDTRFKWVGEAKIASQDKRTSKSIAEAHRFTTTTNGTRVVLFEGLSHSSFAAETLDQEADLVVGFSYRVEDGKRILVFSTRSHTNFDCSSFARSHGGGGHTKAAGFSLRLSEGDPNPYSMFEHLLFAYEAGREHVGTPE